MNKLITFQEALTISSGAHNHLLTGNGFSIACRSDIFQYNSLFEQSDFTNLDPAVKRIFEALKTKDFEIVMRSLKSTCEILKIYDPQNEQLIKRIEKDIEGLKAVLVNAIANSHPENPLQLTEDEFNKCGTFLSHFRNCYTLNYDLLLYWTFMHFREINDLKSDDGFRTPEDGKREYVSWDIEKTDDQNLFYLHGALHIFDAGSVLQKYTWVNTGVSLIEQIRSALDNGLFPVIVSEGTSLEKTEKIMHSNYLSRGLRSFSHIGGNLFIFGHSLANNDSHILNLIPISKIRRLFVSIHGNLDSKENQEIVKTAENLVSKRKGKIKLELFFYDANTAHIWN